MPDTVYNFWPFDSYRRLQRKTLAAITKAFASGKDVVVVEAPTGTGKSPIAIAIARWMLENPKYADIGDRAARIEGGEDKVQRGAYILTTQKLLQRQYAEDFSEHERYPLVEMRGRGNFRCQHDDNPKATCENGVCHTWAETGRPVMLGPGEAPPGDIEEKTAGDGRRYYVDEFKINACCRYRREKARVLSCPLVIHNFAYFLTETNYAGEFKPRDLLVVDEAHNVESGLMSFVEVALSEMILSRLGVDMPPAFGKNTPLDELRGWAQETLDLRLRPRLREASGKLGRVMERLRDNPFDEEALKSRDKLRPDHDALDAMCKRLESLSGLDPDNCVLDVETKRVRQGRGFRTFRKLSFKPIDIAPFTEKSLLRFGKKVLMLSATILDPDTFAESLGVDKSNMKFIRIPSTFPPENRKVIVRACGSMARRSIDETLPKLAAAVREVLDTHPDDRGMVHVHSYRIAEFLAKHVKNTRLMFHDSTNRERVLADFMSDTSDNRVLVSPSMTDGLSLDDDLARFQVICKMPFPYLGDPQVSAKKDRYPGWYDLETAKTLMQTFGRVVRGSEDHGVTYVLDGDFERFYRRTRSRMFPSYVQEAISI